MRIVDLPVIATILLDSLAWGLIQPGIAYLAILIPDAWFDAGSWLYRRRRWEANGTVYQRWFRVKAWKSRLPSGGALFRQGFAMHRLERHDAEGLQKWVTETCRAELCHWIAIAPSGLFFLWNPVWVGWVMVAYALLFNLPLIVVQRYNRARLLTLLAQTRSRDA